MPRNWWEDDPIIEEPSTLSRIGQGALGALKGYGEQMYDTMGPLALGPVGYAASAMASPEESFRPSNPDQQMGYNAETVAEYAAGLAGAAPAMARGAARVIRPIANRVSTPAVKAFAAEAAGQIPVVGSVAKAAVRAATATPTTVARAAKATKTAAPLRSVPKQAPKSAPKAAPKAKPVTEKPPAKVAEPAPAQEAEVAPTVLSPGQAASAKHKAQVDFAREIARTNPKVGEKIWMLLDEAGRPVKMLTPDQAAAASRKKLPTTWIRNLWAR